MLTTISPADNRVYVERMLATPSEIDRALAAARRAQAAWRQVAVAERVAVIERFVAAFEAKSAAIAEEISWQMGRPIRYSPGEVRGLAERARYMAAAAEAALADVAVEPKPGFENLLSEINGDLEAHFRGRGHEFYRIRAYRPLGP